MTLHLVDDVTVDKLSTFPQSFDLARCPKGQKDIKFASDESSEEINDVLISVTAQDRIIGR